MLTFFISGVAIIRFRICPSLVDAKVVNGVDSRPWVYWSANLLVPLSKFIMTTTATVDRLDAFYLARLDLFIHAALVSLEQRRTRNSIFHAYTKVCLFLKHLWMIHYRLKACPQCGLFICGLFYSPNSATIAVFGDSRTFLRQSPFSVTVWIGFSVTGRLRSIMLTDSSCDNEMTFLINYHENKDNSKRKIVKSARVQ